MTKATINFLIRIAICTLVINQSAFANTTRIPQKKLRQPSDDLIYQGQQLTSEEAAQLRMNSARKDILSTLNPYPNDLWKDEYLEQLDPSQDELAIEEGSSVQFNDSLATNAGVYFFNVTQQGELQNNVYNVILDKTLHTALLRKNLLRKIGYTVPKMKYLKNLVVTFDTIEQRDHFLHQKIPQKAEASASRWVRNFDQLNMEGNTDLEVHLQDVAVIQPKESDHNNLAMGAPTGLLKSRTRRAISIVYALLDFAENINKVDCHVGRIEAEYFLLPNFLEYTDLNTSLDDARWMLRRIAKLEKQDFKQIVDNAFFPEELQQSILTKIIARRDYLNNLFGMNNEIAPLAKTNYEKCSLETVVSQSQWPGYASRFTFGNAPSPFQDFEYYPKIKLKSEIISNLVTEVNKKLEVFDLNDKRFAFFQDEFNDGLDHFVETGEFKEFKVGTWVGPYLNGNVIVDRDIVIGNFLGTDNLVQLADTIGFSVSAGVHVGIEKFLADWSASVRTGLTYLQTYTHLKPVRTLKETDNEPIKNIMVPLLKMDLAQAMLDLKNLEESSVENNNDQEQSDDELRKQALENIFAQINKSLGVGESLIVTKRLVPSAFASGKMNLMGTSLSMIPTINAGAGVDYTMLERLHLYRKDKDTLQIYNDEGKLFSLNFNHVLDYYIPIISIRHRKSFGNASVAIYNVNIHQDTARNPKFYRNAYAIYQLLKNDTFEFLDDVTKPVNLAIRNVNDSSFKLEALIGTLKSLRPSAYYQFTAPNGKSNTLLSLAIKEQKGIGFQNFALDSLNYYIKKKWQGHNYSLSVDRFKNPAHTLWGHAWTTEYQYDATLEEDGLDIEHLERAQAQVQFIRITEKRQGWSASAKKIRKKAKKLNEKYDYALFPKQILTDTGKLKLYDITVNIHLYDQAISAIENLKKSSLFKLAEEYASEMGNKPICGDVIYRFNPERHVSAEQRVRCGEFSSVYSLIDKCQVAKQTQNNNEFGKCLIKLTKRLKEGLEFKDFVKMIGGKDKLYLYATIDGFRVDSETLNDTIVSNTIGLDDGKYSDGPMQTIIRKLGILVNEAQATWIRESIQ